MKFQVAVLDDDPFQLKLMQLHIQEFVQKESVELESYYYKNEEEFCEACKRIPFDIMLFDVDLDNHKSGIEVAGNIRMKNQDVKIIFVTAHKEFAFDAFGVDASGYIAKPFDYEVLSQELRKVINQIKLLRKVNSEKKETVSFICDNASVSVQTEDIIYVERQLNKSIIVTEGKEYPVYESIKGLEERLGKGFVRVSQGIIVNMIYVEAVKKSEVILKKGNHFVIGRTYKKEIRESFFEK